MLPMTGGIRRPGVVAWGVLGGSPRADHWIGLESVYNPSSGEAYPAGRGWG